MRISSRLFLAMLFLASCADKPNAGTIQKATQSLIAYLKAGDVIKASQEYSVIVFTKMSQEELTKDLEKSGKETAISTFAKLQVCEWALAVIDGDQFITGQGLLAYSAGSTRFISTLRRDPDNIWRIAGFRLDAQIVQSLGELVNRLTYFGSCHL